MIFQQNYRYIEDINNALDRVFTHSSLSRSKNLVIRLDFRYPAEFIYPNDNTIFSKVLNSLIRNCTRKIVNTLLCMGKRTIPQFIRWKSSLSYGLIPRCEQNPKSISDSCSCNEALGQEFRAFRVRPSSYVSPFHRGPDYKYSCKAKEKRTKLCDYLR